MQTDIREFFQRHGSDLRVEESLAYASLNKLSSTPWSCKTAVVNTFANCVLAAAKVKAKYHTLPVMFTYGMLPETHLIRLQYSDYSKFIKPFIIRSRDRSKSNVNWEYEKNLAPAFIERFGLDDVDYPWIQTFREGSVGNVVALNTILMQCIAVNVPSERPRTL